MEKRLLISFVIAALLLQHVSSTPSRVYKNCLIVATDIDLRFYWEIQGTTIGMAMEGNVSAGYLALGLGTVAGRMDSGGENEPGKFADGWATSYTRCGGCLLDLWMPNEAQPRLDTSNDLRNVIVTVSNGYIIAEWSRPLNTGDDRDFIIDGTPVHLLYAWNAISSIRDDFSIPSHTREGTVALNFMRDSSCDAVEGNTFVSADGKFRLSWQIEGDSIKFSMDADVTGWLAFGINPSSAKMANSDMYVGWISGGTAVVVDSWAEDINMPTEDTQKGGTSDIIDPTGSQAGGVTRIAFTRKLKTADPNDVEITDTNVYLVWSYHDSQPGDARRVYPEHTAYGSGQVNFFSGTIEPSLLEVMTPAYLLTLVVGFVACVYLSIRFIHKCHKNLKTTKKKQAVNEQSKPQVFSPQPAPFNPNNYTPNNPYRNSYRNSYSTQDQVAPQVGRAYYRGSMRFVAPADASDYGYDYNDDQGSFYNTYKYGQGQETNIPNTSHFSNPKTYNFSNETSDDSAIELRTESTTSMSDLVMDTSIPAKSAGSTLGNILGGLLSYRIPMTDKSVFHVLIGVIYVGINIGCLFITEDYATGVGSLICANAVFLIIPATRNSFMVYLTHVPIDKAIMYHRWLGRFVFILSSIHAIWQLVNWETSIAERIATLENYCGLFAWITTFLMLVTSLEWIRRKKFEVFFYSHFIFVAFYVLASFHSPKFVPWAYAAGSLYVLDRLLRIVWGLIPMKTVLLHVKDKENKVVQMRFKKHFLAKLFKLYGVGQYVFVNFPGISLLEWHPFSISSGPEEQTVEIHIKGLGNHTAQLVQNAAQNIQMWIRVDGPYGNPKINHRRFPVLLLIAGGIGITPIMGILKDIFGTGDVDPNARKHRCVVEQVHLIYTIQSEPMYCWFSQEFNDMYEAAKQQPSLPQLNVNIYVTKPTENMHPLYFKGRPNFDEIFDSVVKQNPDKACMVFVCGPMPIVATCWDIANSKSLKGHKIHFHHETFQF